MKTQIKYFSSFLSLALAVLVFISPAIAQVVSPPPVTPPPLVFTTITQTTTVQLGDLIIFVQAPAPTPPVTLTSGHRLQIIAPPPGADRGPVIWMKNGLSLTSGGTTLDLVTTTPDDSGVYSARVKSASGSYYDSASVNVVVSHQNAQRVINTSARTRIDNSQPVFVSGFVVEPGPDKALLLIRAAGPALTAFGVSGALTAPQLRLFDSQNREYRPNALFFPFGPSTSEFASRVGAFPFPSGSKDVAQLYFVAAGAYTVQVSSADGSPGTVLFEIYQVPIP